MTQPEIARSIGTSIVMLVAGFAMLIAAVIAFTVHAIAVGDVLLVLMIACGAVSFAASVRSGTVLAPSCAPGRSSIGRLEDSFRKPLP
jgi:hypothetical protein